MSVFSEVVPAFIHPSTGFKYDCNEQEYGQPQSQYYSIRNYSLGSSHSSITGVGLPFLVFDIPLSVPDINKRLGLIDDKSVSNLL